MNRGETCVNMALGLIAASLAVVMVLLHHWSSTAPTPLNPSSRVESTISGILTSYPNVVGIEISQIDLVKNRDYLIFARFSEPDVQRQYQDVQDNHSPYAGPAFSEDHDYSNRYMVRVLGGEFACLPIERSIELAYLSTPPSRLSSTVCSLPIPPDSSAVHGVLSVFFRNPPTEYEVDLTRVIITDLVKEMESKR